MGQVLKKENITVVTGTYQDRQTGQQKNRYRTIGELVTMQGDDGSVYQFGELWGPHGVTKFNAYEQQEQGQQPAPQQQPTQGGCQQPPAQQPQQQYAQQPPQAPQGHPGGGYGTGHR